VAGVRWPIGLPASTSCSSPRVATSATAYSGRQRFAAQASLPKPVNIDRLLETLDRLRRTAVMDRTPPIAARAY
jgi:hypothetical protein